MVELNFHRDCLRKLSTLWATKGQQTHDAASLTTPRNHLGSTSPMYVTQ